ncbi:hypothetical protein ABZ860_19270 [Microbispora sp. NPDC046973]|uniref:hypothetical protein n=1 Tax=Microbispora sp. NPDC046973 TaxID=3155022 RepID=UPI0033D6CB7D
MRRGLALTLAVLCVLPLAACRRDERTIDRTPMPTAATAPYVCGHIPLKAVQLMTGVVNPHVRGGFDLASAGGIGEGSCILYRNGGDRLKVLEVGLAPDGYQGEVDDQIEDGATPLPEIVPGATGCYYKSPGSGRTDAFALLVRGRAELAIRLAAGVEGRDNAGDVMALMKLIAPKLITDASAPSASPSVSGKG